jgi:hypothetical protein
VRHGRLVVVPTDMLIKPHHHDEDEHDHPHPHPVKHRHREG